MLAQESVREGRLDEALAELQAQVRKEPGDAHHRVFLFQLLAVLGQWDRARTQLEAAGELDPRTMPMVYAYRAALAAEAARAAVFSGRASPAVIGEPEEWMAWLIEALRLTAAGEHARAGELRSRAFDAAAATSGEVDGTPFEWIADADARLGPMLEVVVNGRYGWLPFQRMRAMRLEAPADLRDLVWMPAFLTLEGGAEVAALVPARYPGSETSGDPRIRLARRTEWTELGAGTGCWAGAGQRMLATDRGDHPLMDVRAVRLRSEDARAAGGPSAPEPHPGGSRG
jgi:type VI secretion system protein ImpE